MFKCHGLSDTGCVRRENQDRILTGDSGGLFVVADGMGGHRHGEIAAEMALAALRGYLASAHGGADDAWPFGFQPEHSLDANRLITGIQLANQQVWSHARQKPECAGMGTTIAALLHSGGTAIVGNVGDSRVYVFRGGALMQLSYDDTFAHALEVRGATADGAARRALRSVLTQAAGPEERVQVHIREEPLHRGDVYLLCSDGLHGVIGDAAIGAILAEGADVEIAAQRLHEAARAQGGPDNISVVLLSWNG